MSQFPIFRYKLDMTGTNPENLVTYELVQLSNASGNRTIVPKNGAFYAASMKVKQVGVEVDAVSNFVNIPLTGNADGFIVGSVELGNAPGPTKYVVLNFQTIPTQNGLYAYVVDGGGSYTLTKINPGALLTPGTQYKSFMLNQDATRGSGGKFVDQLLVLTDESVQGWLLLEYQSVGGCFSTDAVVLQELITILALDSRPVIWHDIIELPAGFNPTPHYHHSSEYFGYGGMISALERMILSILSIGETAPGINRFVFPEIADYNGPVFVEGSEDEEVPFGIMEAGDGSILTYLGKVTAAPIVDENAINRGAVIRYVSQLEWDGTEDLPEEGLLTQGELTVTIDLNAGGVTLINKILNHRSQIKTDFLFVPTFDEDTGNIDAAHIFEQSSVNRSILAMSTDEPADVVVFSDGLTRIKMGEENSITFDGNTLTDLMMDVNGTGSLILGIDGEVVSDPYGSTPLAQFYFSIEDEAVNLRDLAPLFPLINDINNAARAMENKTKIISNLNF